MIIAGQQEELCLLSLKRRDSFIYCTHCTLPSRVQTRSVPRSQPNNGHGLNYQSTSRQSLPNVRRSNRMSTNTKAEICPATYAPSDVAVTLRLQLRVANYNRSPDGYTHYVKTSRRFLISASTHDLPPAFGCFAGLRSSPYNPLYFVKLHVVDLGLIRQMFFTNQHSSTEDLLYAFVTYNGCYQWLLPVTTTPSLSFVTSSVSDHPR